MLALATRQHGVVSTRQLKALGYGRNSASKANRVGRLRRIYRGVYAVGHTDLSWRGECMAAVLAHPPATASHWTAARLWGLIRSTSTFHLAVPTERLVRKRRFVLHFIRLRPDEVAKVEGIPATSLARTVLDLAPLLDRERLDKLLQRAEELKHFDLRDFEALLERSKHHPGHAILDRALRIYRPDATVTRSDLERDFRALVRAAELPAPAMNHVVGPYEIDAYWEAERFGVELDVFATHGSRLSFERDRERADDLLAIGVEITRVTDIRLEREAGEVMKRLAAHLERRRPTPPVN